MDSVSDRLPFCDAFSTLPTSDPSDKEIIEMLSQTIDRNAATVLDMELGGGVVMVGNRV